jgi:UDP-N-acetylmuramoyl-L-alanyl-D-glutamate--2,6-diaminopimelate ligase
MEEILNLAKKFIPKGTFLALQPAYHFVLAWLASVWYGRPSEKMIVIGVTGTTGKTTTIFLIENILKTAGIKAGSVSTAIFSDGEKTLMNDQKMTMPGRFFTQKLLRQMLKNRCAVAIVETTSQGIEQFRHRFINYDILVFTGLYPEHIEAHGGFENYKKAKGKLFAHLKACRKKKTSGLFALSSEMLRTSENVLKTIIVNADDEHASHFLSFWADRKVAFGIKNNSADIKAQNIIFNASGLYFNADGLEFRTGLLGEFNVINSLAAISAAKSLNIPDEKIKAGLEKIIGVPGRLEKISNKKGITIIVDYAFEPNAMSKLYATVKSIPHERIIHVLGSCGGGRDKSRRPKLGKLAGKKADLVIVTNEDPYDEDPMEIIDEVAAGAEDKRENINIWKILDRREAIKKALSLAQKNDLVLVTGKGNEQVICVANGQKIFWDDRKIIREILQEIR